MAKTGKIYCPGCASSQVHIVGVEAEEEIHDPYRKVRITLECQGGCRNILVMGSNHGAGYSYTMDEEPGPPRLQILPDRKEGNSDREENSEAPTGGQQYQPDGSPIGAGWLEDPFNDEDEYRSITDVTHDSRLCCPKCGFECIHIADARLVPPQIHQRQQAIIALDCEMGCFTTLVLGNYKGNGYSYTTDGGPWSDRRPIRNSEDEDGDEDEDRLVELQQMCRRFPKITETPMKRLRENMKINAPGTERQIKWLRDMCRKSGVDEHTLITLGVRTGRIHPSREDGEQKTLADVTKAEAGALIAFVELMEELAETRNAAGQATGAECN